MPINYNKVAVRIDRGALRANYRLLAGKGSRLMAVIKSDAYGHGLAETAEVLAEEGAESFAVGTVEEAVQLRECGCAGRIVSLLGPIDAWEYPAMWEHGVLPFVGNGDQLAKLADAARKQDRPLDICLKFDTGMSRLGFRLEGMDVLLDRLADLPGVRPVMAASHLATADEPEKAEYVRRQGELFAAIVARLRGAGYDVEASLANSAGILGHPEVHHQTQRAGIALYGVNPFAGTGREQLGRGLTPAMSVSVPVLEVHDLPRGGSISYGCTFTADRDMRVAIVAAGYADCYSRGLSGKGWMNLRGKRAPILGRVCMQLTAVDAGAVQDVRVGDTAWLLGGPGEGSVLPGELSSWWGTIPYEVFCLLGLNRREYV